MPQLRELGMDNWAIGWDVTKGEAGGPVHSTEACIGMSQVIPKCSKVS